MCPHSLAPIELTPIVAARTRPLRLEAVAAVSGRRRPRAAKIGHQPPLPHTCAPGAIPSGLARLSLLRGGARGATGRRRPAPRVARGQPLSRAACLGWRKGPQAQAGLRAAVLLPMCRAGARGTRRGRRNARGGHHRTRRCSGAGPARRFTHLTPAAGAPQPWAEASAPAPGAVRQYGRIQVNYNLAVGLGPGGTVHNQFRCGPKIIFSFDLGERLYGRWREPAPCCAAACIYRAGPKRP